MVTDLETERRKTVFAELPRCPACGVKDRGRVKGGTYRPLGNRSALKVQYVRCEVCEHEYRIRWS